MSNWLQEMENRLDSLGLVPAEISAIEKQITDLKVCKHLLLIHISLLRMSFDQPVVKDAKQCHSTCIMIQQQQYVK